MESKNDKIFLITGATGKQGGAAARHLFNAGVKVRALTRKPESTNAKALRELGIEVVKGDLNDITSLEVATEGVHGVFAVTNFWELGTGKKEVQQNKNLADAAKKNGVQHYVLASIARCDDNPNLAHFATKYECEKYIQSIEMPYTFLRAVYFMENLKPGAQGASFHWAILPTTLKDKTTLQMISVEDIGWFAANAFLYSNEYLNKTLDIAGDEVTYPKIYASYKKVFGTEPKKSALMKILLPIMMPEVKKMFVWYQEPRFSADIKHLKSIHPKLTSLEEYFEKVKDKK